MTKISEEFPLGNIDEMDVRELAYNMQKMYRTLAVAINSKITVVVRDDDGQATDTFLPVGTININDDALKVEILTSYTDPNTVVWTQIN